MGVILAVCTAFGLTLSEAKTEIMCVRYEWDAGGHRHISAKAIGMVYNQMNEFVYREGNVNHNACLSIEVDRRIFNAWCSF